MMVPENLRKANNNSNLIWKLDCLVELAFLTPATDRQQEDPVLVLEHTHCVNNGSNKNKNKQTNSKSLRTQIRWKRVTNIPCRTFPVGWSKMELDHNACCLWGVVTCTIDIIPTPLSRRQTCSCNISRWTGISSLTGIQTTRSVDTGTRRCQFSGVCWGDQWRAGDDWKKWQKDICSVKENCTFAKDSWLSAKMKIS